MVEWDTLECEDNAGRDIVRTGALLRSINASDSVGPVRKRLLGRTRSVSPTASARSGVEQADRSSRSQFLSAIGGAVGNLRDHLTSWRQVSPEPAYGDDSCAFLAPTSSRLASAFLDLEALEAIQERSSPNVDWDDYENSVLIHSAVNTLRNNVAALKLNEDMEGANTTVGKMKSALLCLAQALEVA